MLVVSCGWPFIWSCMISFYMKKKVTKRASFIICLFILSDERLHSPCGFISSSVYKAFIVVVFCIMYVFLCKENTFLFTEDGVLDSWHWRVSVIFVVFSIHWHWLLDEPCIFSIWIKHVYTFINNDMHSLMHIHVCAWNAQQDTDSWFRFGHLLLNFSSSSEANGFSQQSFS